MQCNGREGERAGEAPDECKRPRIMLEESGLLSIGLYETYLYEGSRNNVLLELMSCYASARRCVCFPRSKYTRTLACVLF